MKTKQIWGNLAVKDVSRTRKFFTDLGFKPNKGYDGGDELASFLFGDNDFAINFFIEKRLQTAMGNPIADPKNGNEVMFSLSAESREEVEEWASKVKKAGGNVFSEPKEFMGMYGCGFADLDGHRWNILYMPKK